MYNECRLHVLFSCRNKGRYILTSQLVFSALTQLLLWIWQTNPTAKHYINFSSYFIGVEYSKKYSSVHYIIWEWQVEILWCHINVYSWCNVQYHYAKKGIKTSLVELYSQLSYGIFCDITCESVRIIIKHTGLYRDAIWTWVGAVCVS